MSIFKLVRDGAMEGIANVGKGIGNMNDTKDKVQGLKANVTQSWIGMDHTSFEQEIATRLIPMTMDFIAALAGLNTNTASAVSIMDQADSAAKGLADQMKGEFSGI